MATVTHILIPLLFLAFMAFPIGVQCRSLRAHLRKMTSFQGERKIRTGHVQRRIRREPDSERDQCDLQSAPWTESTTPSDPSSDSLDGFITVVNWGTTVEVSKEYKGKKLEKKESYTHLGWHEDSSIEFLLGEDVLSAPLVRAEVHFHFSNPQHLNIQPVLPSLEKRGFPTRYSVWKRDGVLELRVDLLGLFQALQLAIGGDKRGPSLMDMHRVRGLTRPGALGQRERPPSLQDTAPVEWGEENEDGEGAAPLKPALELGLALHYSLAHNILQSCQTYGVQLTHAPFITLAYR